MGIFLGIWLVDGPGLPCFIRFFFVTPLKGAFFDLIYALNEYNYCKLSFGHQWKCSVVL